MKFNFHCPSMASEIWDVFAPDGCKKVIAPIQTNVQETGYNEDEVRFGEDRMTSIQYQFSGKNSWVINGILIQVSHFVWIIRKIPKRLRRRGAFFVLMVKERAWIWESLREYGSTNGTMSFATTTTTTWSNPPKRRSLVKWKTNVCKKIYFPWLINNHGKQGEHVRALFQKNRTYSK